MTDEEVTKCDILVACFVRWNKCWTSASRLAEVPRCIGNWTKMCKRNMCLGVEARQLFPSWSYMRLVHMKYFK